MAITVTQLLERTEVRDNGALTGYVENGVLYGIDAMGYAQEAGEVNHLSEVVGKLKEWQKKQEQGKLV